MRISPKDLEARMKARRLGNELRNLALDDIFDLLGSRVADRNQLLAFAGEGLLNTDDLPIVMFKAPAFVYRERVAGSETLAFFLDHEPASASDLLMAATGESLPDDLAPRIESYVRARDEYIAGQMALSERRMEAALGHYVKSVELSVDFNAGYPQVISLASVPGLIPKAAALTAVESIVRARPNFGDLRQLRRQLGGR